jgi:uncharacterized protein (TIGR03067 family)
MTTEPTSPGAREATSSPSPARGEGQGNAAPRRRRLAIALALVGLGAGGFGLGYAVLRDAGPRDDLGRFQGEWKVAVPGRTDAAPLVIRVTGDTWTYVAGGMPRGSYRLTLDPAANPKEIDLLMLGPDGEPLVRPGGPLVGAEVKLHGVYRVEKDRATVALAPASEPRPTSLDDPGDAQVLNLERAKK